MMESQVLQEVNGARNLREEIGLTPTPTREFRERIKVGRASKGNYTFEFTVETDPNHLKTTDELIEKVQEIQGKLEALYPMEQVEK